MESQNDLGLMSSLKLFNNFVRERGHWLMEEMNWDLWLLSKSDALEALAILETEAAMILGGDAFFQDPDGRPNYGVSVGHIDSFWRFQKQPDESFIEACTRSKTSARRFIESFPENTEGFIGIEFSACDSNGYRRIQELKLERELALQTFTDQLRTYRANDDGD